VNRWGNWEYCVGMSHPAGARWYRTDLSRWALAAFPVGGGFSFGAPFLVHGIAHTEILPAVAGAVVLLLAGLLAFRILRTGMGATDTHLLIRGVLGPVQAVPWRDVTGFAVTKTGRTQAFSALGQDGQRWSTAGCSPAGWNRQEDELARWRLTRALEDERLAASPGAASEVPSAPPEPAPASWARRWGRRLSIDTALVVFLGLTVWLAWVGASSVGLAFRAADGAGTPGYFLAQSESCARGGDCSWYGEFRLPGGRVARTDVTIVDAPGGMKIGAPVAAVDVGDNDTARGGSGVVYPAHDPGAWSTAVTDLVLGAAWAALLLSALLAQVLRRPRLPEHRLRASDRSVR
jgi:hypothetical protein